MAASINDYKQYGRNKRQATLQTSFESGMMYSDGMLEEGYLKTLVNYSISANNSSLVPRAGLRVEEVILPDSFIEDYNDPYNSSNDLSIKAAKECVEADGNTYRQFILGNPELEKLWVATAPLTEGYVERDELPYNELKYALINNNVSSNSCKYFNVPLTKVHGVDLVANSKVSSLVGTFAFGNRYHFIDPVQKKYMYTSFDDETKAYRITEMSPLEITPSEAVSYGYNALLGDKMYDFFNKSYVGIMQLTGILPYSTVNTSELLLNPRKNEDILFKCFFKAKVGNKYKFVWEWRNIESNTWESLVSFDKAVEYEIVAGTGDNIRLKDGDNIIDSLEVTFKAPSENVLVRVQAFNSSEYTNLAEGTDPVTEAAMTVGFDFTSTTDNKKQTVYDLTTATGMAYWKNRLIVWGLSDDPTVLFFSDLNEPLYFPYPNNIVVFDEPIVDAKVYMDSLIVFTTSKVHQVTTENGTSWNTTILQSNLNIEPRDRHLIHIVRNMIFFKSGNYYFMIVPKAQSLTGELTLAPVSTSIKDFFNHFRNSVQGIIKDTFNVATDFEIVDFFNFLDYEDVHNMYVLTFEGIEGYLYFDLAYNTVSRVWKIFTYESKDLLYPYKHDATQTGTIAATSLVDVRVADTYTDYEIVSKTPLRTVNTTSKLVLSEQGFDLSFSEPILVRIFRPDGNLDREIHFSEALLDADNKIVFPNDDYSLESEISDTDVDFTLAIKGNVPEFHVGSSVAIYRLDNMTSPVWGPIEVYPYYNTCFLYDFEPNSITNGTTLEINEVQYTIDSVGEYLSASSTDVFKIKAEAEGYLLIFANNALLNRPTVKLFPNIPAASTTGRCIQLYSFDSTNMQDFYIPKDTKLVYFKDVSKYAVNSIKETLVDAIDNSGQRYTFKNWQFIDTGYRNDNSHLLKRFRELQLQINNIGGEDLHFGLEFLLDGERRTTHLVFDTEYVTDLDDPNYGVVYVEPTAVENIFLPDTVELNTWNLNQSLFPELSLWKVRVPVSGKGLTPRLRLLSKNDSMFELPSINWIYRIMNMR